MPTLNADQLLQLGISILRAAGASPEEAATVAGELRNANLVGHDSHGVMRLVQYVELIEQGYIKPGSAIEIVTDRPAFAVLDAHFNFGQVAATRALTIGREIARDVGVSTVVIRNCNHVGRLGSYTQKGAEQGLACMMAVNAPGPGGVSPYGGVERKLGTNPISMAAPWNDGALVLDMTTSATAEGKLRVAFQKGESVPEGWIIDSEGNPTTDPADYYNKPYGSILPFGGPWAFKGYGLSVMIDLFAGVLSNSGLCRTDLPRGANGVWMYFLDIKQFISDVEYHRWLDGYVEQLKQSKKMPGVDEILLPGEIEQNRRQQRQADGVALPDETWRQIGELAARLDVSLEFLNAGE